LPAPAEVDRLGHDCLLSHTELFRDFPEKDLRPVEQACRYRRFSPQEIIVDRDSLSQDVYLVIRGRVRIVNYSMSGREITFDDLEEGAYFGELSALDGEPRSASVVALTETMIVALPRRVFLDVLAKHPDVALKVMVRMSMIIRLADDRIMDLSSLAANNRVQAELLREARRHSCKDNMASISPIPIHSDIASRVSTTRETVARVLNDLARQGIVERTKKALIVHDLELLEEMVEEVRG
jgi:CRP-like cAMP-binding protein